MNKSEALRSISKVMGMLTKSSMPAYKVTKMCRMLELVADFIFESPETADNTNKMVADRVVVDFDKRSISAYDENHTTESFPDDATLAVIAKGKSIFTRCANPNRFDMMQILENIGNDDSTMKVYELNQEYVYNIFTGEIVFTPCYCSEEDGITCDYCKQRDANDKYHDKYLDILLNELSNL